MVARRSGKGRTKARDRVVGHVLDRVIRVDAPVAGIARLETSLVFLLVRDHVRFRIEQVTGDRGASVGFAEGVSRVHQRRRGGRSYVGGVVRVVRLVPRLHHLDVGERAVQRLKFLRIFRGRSWSATAGAVVIVQGQIRGQVTVECVAVPLPQIGEFFGVAGAPHHIPLHHIARELDLRGEAYRRWVLVGDPIHVSRARPRRCGGTRRCATTSQAQTKRSERAATVVRQPQPVLLPHDEHV